MNINELKYIKQCNIDKEKWNKCIAEADNSRVYADYGHLERVAPNWDALVLGNYEYVMPLPIRKKFGFKYVYQPPYSQQLGIFPKPSVDVFNAFIDKLKSHFRYFDIQLNSGSVPLQILDETGCSIRKNYLLPLNENYETLYAAFSKSAKKNISKAVKARLSVMKNIGLQEFIDFKNQNLSLESEVGTLPHLKKLISADLLNGHGQIYGVYTDKNELCAANYFCNWGNRFVYLNAVSNKEGKNAGAMYFLLDRFIANHAGTNKILDFEGSMIPGIAEFFERFGPTAEHYYHYKHNNLPLFLRRLKK